MHQAQLGDRVRIQYSRLRKRVVTSAEPRAPKVLEFTVGSSDILPSVSFGVVGMAPGDRRQFTLPPQETNGRVPAGLARQKQALRAPKQTKLRMVKPRTAVIAASDFPGQATIVDSRSEPVLAGDVIELEVMLLSLDSSSNANQNLPQFDLGGEG